MRKQQIVALANRNKTKFEGKNPTEVLNILRNHEGYKQIFQIWDAKDIVTFVFLLTTPDIDLSIAYDVITINMFAFQMIEIMEDDPDVECDYCEGKGYNYCGSCNGNGDERCDYCDEGNIDCDTCDGDGKDSDGDNCDECNGKGYNRCYECDGDGWITCNECDGEGEHNCHSCNATGEVTKHGSKRVEGKQIISYNPDISNMVDDTFVKVSDGFYDNSGSKFYNLVIKDLDYVSEGFDDYNLKDILIVQVIENNALDLDKNRFFNIGCNNFDLI